MESASSPSTSRTSTAQRQRKDAVLGLDVGGTTYYCRKSTLLGANGNSSSYFDGRFGPDSMMDPEIEYIDERGREVYFIDRDPSLFKYVLEYLRTQELPSGIGNFQTNSHTWRALRKEAAFFALDGLVALLKVTFSCSPDHGLKGILYWLGTNKGRDNAYINPYTRGDIDITGWFDNAATLKRIIDVQREMGPPGLDLASEGNIYFASGSRALFVQYRPKENPITKSLALGQSYTAVFDLMGCLSGSLRLPVVIDFKTVKVSPSYYSLRYGGCDGMEGDWNFEASNNGKNWIVLHAARDDIHLLRINGKHDPERHASGQLHWLRDATQDLNEGEKEEVYCDYMERFHRHTWEVNNSSGDFYRYFRIIGASPEGSHKCLHGIGLEIFGLAQEE